MLGAGARSSMSICITHHVGEEKVCACVWTTASFIARPGGPAGSPTSIWPVATIRFLRQSRTDPQPPSVKPLAFLSLSACLLAYISYVRTAEAGTGALSAPKARS